MFLRAVTSGRGERGFTLIELMIVIAIIAIIASISIPNLLAAKVNANETSAIATMRNLVSAQAQVAVSGRIDADRDGKGEYGTFLELSGGVGLRRGFVPGPPALSDFSVKGPFLSPGVLSSVFSRVDANGFTTKSGYAFQILLPDGASPTGFVHEVGPAAGAAFDGGSGSVGVDASEVTWCVYAQPMQIGGSGTRRFFTNQRGDLTQSRNEVARGQGNLTPVVGNSAFRGAGITSVVAVGTKGNDGDVWVVTN